MFLTQFLPGRKRKRTLAYLLNLKQGDSEALKDFIHRFNQERLNVEDVPKNLILAMLLNGLSLRVPLMAELPRKMLATLQDFMDKAEEFINQEEAFRDDKEYEDEQAKKPKGGGKDSRISEGGDKKSKEAKQVEKRKLLTEQEFNFTPTKYKCR